MINRDRVVVFKADGTELGETWATVTPNLIVISNVSPQINEGDTIVRKSEEGPDESYRVVEAAYYAGTGAHYQLKVEKQGL
jgi:hypothetical protein